MCRYTTLKNKIDFTCSVRLITTRSMKATTVAPSKDECAICLVSETTVLTQKFVCGCVVKAHSTCLNQWFSKPESNCVYCRKPTVFLPIASPLISRPIDVSPVRPASANILRGRRLTPPSSVPTPPRTPAPPPRTPAPPPRTPAPPPRTPASHRYTKSNSSTYSTAQIMVLLGIKAVLITIVTLLIVLL